MVDLEELENKPKGFAVHFERHEPPFLRSDYIPDRNAGEALLPTYKEAWDLAHRVARVVENAVNIYVVDEKFVPVSRTDGTINRYCPSRS
jgi:hypothetical protein